MYCQSNVRHLHSHTFDIPYYMNAYQHTAVCEWECIKDEHNKSLPEVQKRWTEIRGVKNFFRIWHTNETSVVVYWGTKKTRKNVDKFQCSPKAIEWKCIANSVCVFIWSENCKILSVTSEPKKFHLKTKQSLTFGDRTIWRTAISIPKQSHSSQSKKKIATNLRVPGVWNILVLLCKRFERISVQISSENACV